MASNFVIYARTSTRNQHLGIQAQLSAARLYIEQQSGKILAEFVEHESGRNNNRPELQKAIDFCEKEKAILLVAKLDRLSRNVSFLFQLRDALQEKKVEFLALDVPEISNTLILGVFASLAQRERELISERTKAALAVRRAQGVKIGRQKGADLTVACTMAAEARKQYADDWARKNGRMIFELHKAGYPNQKIANVLNEQGIQTRRGGKWTSTSVRRVIERLSEQA